MPKTEKQHRATAVGQKLPDIIEEWSHRGDFFLPKRVPGVRC
jgi:hypothetical protein